MKRIKNIFLLFVSILLISAFFNKSEENFYEKNINKNIYIETINKEKGNKIEVKYFAGIDGDTAKFEIDEKIVKVRFLGIDTPETPNSPREEGFLWEEASNFTKEKLENANKIELEYDDNSSKTDKYNRTLAWVFVDGELLQEKIVSNGLAKIYALNSNNKYYQQLNQAEKSAKSKKIGIWSTN